MRTALALFLLLPGLALAGPATVVRQTEIRKEPAFDSVALARLAQGAKVEAMERRGGWTRVKSEAGEQGWVRMLLLRHEGAGAARQGESGVVAAINVARTGTSGRQVTTGVRGLDAEQLANARPNAAELQKLQGYAASRDAAAQFAGAGELQAQRVDYPKEGE
jgi:SH3-like domain-containing protein